MNGVDYDSLKDYAVLFSTRAGANLAKWGNQDFKTLGLAICEEAGEVAQAILQAEQENGERIRIQQEAVDLGALCVQVLSLFDLLGAAHGKNTHVCGEEISCRNPGQAEEA